MIWSIPASSTSWAHVLVVATTFPVASDTLFDELDNLLNLPLEGSALTRDATTNCALAPAISWEAAISSSNFPEPQITLSADSLF